MAALKLAFMGTPDFALPTLKALIDAGHEIACVYCQPPRPAGRGQKPKLCPVHAFADAEGLAVRTPQSLRRVDDIVAFTSLGLDGAVVVAYGLILPKEILDAPRLGCINVHASLLPRWRGAAPIQRAVQAGDAETGVTIMQMDEGLDTGDMLAKGRFPIGPGMSAGALHDQLADLGAELAVSTLKALAGGSVQATPQPDAGVTYAAKLEKSEARLDWTRPAAELARDIQAFNPWPGAWFEHGAGKKKERLKVFGAAVEAGQADPGEVLDGRGLIACGEGALRLLKIQRAGKGAADADAFFRGYDLPKGTRLS